MNKDVLSSLIFCYCYMIVLGKVLKHLVYGPSGNSSSQSSQSSSSSQSSFSPASVSPSSPSFSPIAETLHGDDSGDANMENVPVPPPATNPMTASDDEMYHGVISDVNLLNSSAQSTDVDIDQELYNPKRSAEAS